jgi:hypothetical protein
MRLIRRSGIPIEEFSQAAPALARCLAERQVIYTNILSLISIFAFVILLSPMYLPLGVDTEDFPLSTLETQVVFPILIVVGISIIRKYDDDFRRILNFSAGYQRLIAKYLWIAIFAPMGVVALLDQGESLKAIMLGMTAYRLAVVTTQSVLILSYFILAYWLARIILRWRAPELTLVRALADALDTVLSASPSNWRSISLRSKAARYIHNAAVTLEGPMARKFAASAGFSDAVEIHNRFQMAGAALRSKVGWLATPRADTKSVLARALALELLIAATGDLDRLEYSEIGQTQATVSWIARSRATASWAIFGLGPAIFVVVSRARGWVNDPTTTAILVQFAFLCFFVAILSAADPSGYKERLASVTGTGVAVFGWRKPGSKD